ncbi:MAG: peptidase T [Acidobacteria bacterium]|nr:peptidase T [Acidobacteriota bacterium]
MINRDELLDRFTRYVKIYTTSDEESETFPSTERQFELANLLAAELKEMGIKDVEVDRYGYVYARIPSNIEKDIAPVGFIAHMDTAPAESGENVKPQIIRNYDGGKIPLPGDPGVVISPEENPILKELSGDDLITSDGTTLLGADDKAGIAEIMTAAAYMTAHPEFKHGEIRIAFTPDEEVGRGVDHFDVKKFGAKFAYTLDGGRLGELEDETFCADSADVICRGINVHPGYAKDKMVNAIRMAGLFMTLLDENTLPETTENRQDYYHATGIKGMENETVINMIVRSFTVDGLKDREKDLERIRLQVLEKFPGGEIEIVIKEQYRNMKEILDRYPEVLKTAEKAFEKAGIVPIRKPIRGGTDGARLTFMGLPSPNIFAGAINMHSKKEFASLQTMEKAAEVVLHIASVLAEA